MLIKEAITKRLCIKIIKSYGEQGFIALALALPLSFFLLYFGVKVSSYCGLGILTVLYYLIACAIIGCALYFVADYATDLIKLYSGKFYIVEAPLLSKAQNDHIFFHRRRYYSDYIFKFEEYGSYRFSRDLYPWSKENRMDAKMADIITEKNEEFYLLVRGGKRKKIVAVFHKKFFCLSDTDFNSSLYGKYYL